MYSKQTTIINSSGLHARPASDFVLAAKKFESSVTIRRAEDGSPAVNAKSIVRLLAAGIRQGVTIELEADGSDEQAAVDSLVALIETGFGEE